MVDIKNFIFKSVSVLVLMLSLVLLSAFLLLASITEDFAKIKKEIGKEIGSLLKTQLEQSSEFNFSIEELKKACQTPSMIDGEIKEGFDLNFICKQFEEGKISSKEELISALSENVAKQGLDGATLGINVELIKLKGLGLYALIGGSIGLVVSFGFAYLVAMKLSKGVETFGYYSFILGFAGMIAWIIIYFLAPATVNILSDLLMKQLNDQPISEFGPIVEKVLSSAVSIVREVLLRPVYLHLVIGLGGLIVWKTRLGLKAD